MKRIICAVTILALLCLGLSFHIQKTSIWSADSETNLMQVSSAQLVLKGQNPVSASLSNMKTDRIDTSVLRGLLFLLFLIFSATFLGLTLRSLSSIFSLCLLFISPRLLQLKALYAQDGKKEYYTLKRTTF